MSEKKVLLDGTGEVSDLRKDVKTLLKEVGDLRKDVKILEEALEALAKRKVWVKSNVNY